MNVIPELMIFVSRVIIVQLVVYNMPMNYYETTKHHKNTNPQFQNNIPIYKDWYVEEHG